MGQGGAYRCFYPGPSGIGHVSTLHEAVNRSGIGFTGSDNRHNRKCVSPRLSLTSDRTLAVLPGLDVDRRRHGGIALRTTR